MMRALAVSVLVGVMCPLLGTYVVTRDLGFMSDALAPLCHAWCGSGGVGRLAPPVGCCALGHRHRTVAGLVGAQHRPQCPTPPSASFFAGLFALGVALLPLVRHVSLNLEDLLLGQVLGASQVDRSGDCDPNRGGGGGALRAAQPVVVRQL